MFLTLDAEDNIVAGQHDFYENLAPGHLPQKLEATIFMHDIHPVTYPFGMGFPYRIPDVKTESFRRYQPRNQFSPMQGQLHPRINAMKVIQHLHMEGKIHHGNIVVFRHHEIQTHKSRISGNQFESGENLSKDNLPRQPPQNLIKIADSDAAPRIRLLPAAF